MKKFAIALFALLFSFSVSFGAEWDVADMNDTIDQTNFLVNTGCSGTLIDVAHGYILTANHCVSQQYETLEREVVDDKGKVTTEKYRHMVPGTVSQLQFNGSEEVARTAYRMTLKKVDYRHDLALVKVIAKLPNTRASHVACDMPVRGDKAYVVGNPMAVLYSSVTVGVVSSVQREYGTIGVDDMDGGVMQISSGVVGGNSGGGVYNASGNLIGVTVRASQINEILGFAVPLDVVKTFLNGTDADATCK